MTDTPEAIGEACQEVDPNEPDQKAEDKGPDDEARVPEIIFWIEPEVQKRHAEVEEDDAVHGGAEHADKVVDCGLCLV